MKNPDNGIFLTAAMALALGLSACGGPSAETPKPPLTTPSSSASPDSSNNTHLQIAPCTTEMPWEGAVQGQKLTITKPVMVFDSMKKPQPTTRPRIQPECWNIVPNVPATANPSETSR